MNQRPKDIQDAWQNLVNKSIQEEFSEKDRESGYARWMAEWWHSMPETATNEQCREWYGILQKETCAAQQIG
ncbi:MAG: hypothetical protein FMNOHCHN_03499 [Ignavibacteriaceae bacterium]|nr:hypothetical protein [Ignavibacteriaceae bacterium]